ncbi:MAG TPA: helix-turn-helix domain-containing protein [Gammaproteobacteria bacterium]|nr:helix-turn-helix domain-containing protein [Gammaproteobacteria bacterium]
MQIKSLRMKSYRSWAVDETILSDKAKEKYQLLQKFWQLRAEGCRESTALEVLGLRRATLYRWQREYRKHGPAGLNDGSQTPHRKRVPKWTRSLEQQVLALRKQYPAWGKTKLSILLQRRGIAVSQSTVGRILHKLRSLNKIYPVSMTWGQLRPKKSRVFNKHAKRWKRDMKALIPGELVQIDHMTITTIPGTRLKHFNAICPVSRVTAARVYLRATAHSAKAFLKHVQKTMPFPIRSIQVDGGSEFMREFEEACADMGIPLYVLPPRSPKLNGCVERCNRTVKQEFYWLYDEMGTAGSVNEGLEDYLRVYNQIRPHEGLNLMSPMAYLHSLSGGCQKSHML